MTLGVPRAYQFLLLCTYLPFGPLSQDSRPVSARTSWQTWNGRWTQISTMRAAEQQRGLLPTPPQGQVGTQQERSRPPPKSPRKTVASLKAKEADEAKKHAEAEKTAKIAWEAKKKAELAKETARKPNERKMPKRQRQRRQRNWQNRQKTPANLQSRRQKRWQQNLKEWPGSSGLQLTQRPERPEG